MTVVNVRGANGSGKTTVVRELMAKMASVTPYKNPGEKGKRPSGYVCSPPDPEQERLVIIGSYEATCGGCDTIATQDGICSAVRLAHDEGHDCVFEGIIVSNIWQRYADLIRETRGVMAFLDTPLDVCLSRVYARRAAAGATGSVKDDQIRDKWNRCQRDYEKCQELDIPAVWLDHTNPLRGLVALLYGNVP